MQGLPCQRPVVPVVYQSRARLALVLSFQMSGARRQRSRSPWPVWARPPRRRPGPREAPPAASALISRLRSRDEMYARLGAGRSWGVRSELPSCHHRWCVRLPGLACASNRMRHRFTATFCRLPRFLSPPQHLFCQLPRPPSQVYPPISSAAKIFRLPPRLRAAAPYARWPCGASSSAAAASSSL